MKKNKTIYLLLGRNGRVDSFIVTILSDMGYNVYGHNLDEAFTQLRFSK